MIGRVLVFGATGQLGRALRAHQPDTVEWLDPPGGRIDFRDGAALQRLVEALQPAVIINAAAYTAVDRAEAEPEAAWAVNAEAPLHLAQGARHVGARMVQVSTDFVFSGRGGTPYQPMDPPEPLNVYGRSKAAGEAATLETLGEDAFVLRTAWVYHPAGGNFVRTMLRLLAERTEVRVVADQIGTPTAADGLAQAVWALLAADATGIHHWTDAGVASWYDFAEAIRELAQTLAPERAWGRVLPIRSEEYPTPARRPPCSVLDKSATWAMTGTPPHWRTQLQACLLRYGLEGYQIEPAKSSR